MNSVKPQKKSGKSTPKHLAKKTEGLSVTLKKSKTPDKATVMVKRESSFDSKQTCQRGIIVQHARDSKNQREELKYHIGRVLGSGMIGVACVCFISN